MRHDFLTVRHICKISVCRFEICVTWFAVYWDETPEYDLSMDFSSPFRLHVVLALCRLREEVLPSLMVEQRINSEV